MLEISGSYISAPGCQATVRCFHSCVDGKRNKISAVKSALRSVTVLASLQHGLTLACFRKMKYVFPSTLLQYVLLLRAVMCGYFCSINAVLWIPLSFFLSLALLPHRLDESGRHKMSM
ncbi:hypothetical protein XENORESO_018107 [Xenotaenia resolanae]|uniref:Vomeronasal type-1 receptor n=1 Tax=Xenotaenia resolanae TaxID=208358 RepID=A0ABV0X588_9TELE